MQRLGWADAVGVFAVWFVSRGFLDSRLFGPSMFLLSGSAALKMRLNPPAHPTTAAAREATLSRGRPGHEP